MEESQEQVVKQLPKPPPKVEQKLLLFVADKTASELEPLKWTKRLVLSLSKRGRSTGWLFQDNSGKQRPLSYFTDKFYEYLFAVHDRKPELFAGGNILEEYHTLRSCRRGATTQATEKGVSPDDINWQNWWFTGQEDKQLTRGPMRALYVKQRLLLDAYLRFSEAL